MATDSTKAPSPSSTLGNSKTNTAEINVKHLSFEKSNSTSTAALLKAYKEIVNDPKTLDEAANYLYQSLIDDAVVGVFLEVHHLRKNGNISAIEGVPEDDANNSHRIVDLPKFDIFGSSHLYKPIGCICPNCEKPASCSKFASHLEDCMGMGRQSKRLASMRLANMRLATRETTSASSSSSSSCIQSANVLMSDDDDADIDLSEKRRKKSRNNSNKKNNGKSF